MDKEYYPHDEHTLKHSVLLLSATFIAFIWSASFLSEYATQAIALLFTIFLIKQMVEKRLSTRQESVIDSVVLTLLTLVAISSTGGLSSPLFFLVYFLLFVLSLLLTPTIPLILSFALIVYFLFSSEINQTSQLIPLFSFPLITPLAVYFGKEHKKTIYQKHDILHLKESIRRETEDIFLWLTTVFAKEMRQLHEIINKFPQVSNEQRPHFSALQKSIDRLKNLGDKLKKAIEED